MAKHLKHTTAEEVREVLTNYKGEHPSFKLMMIDWQRNHKEYYDNFKARIISGDMTVFEEIFGLMQSCVPTDASLFINDVTESASNENADRLEKVLEPVTEIAETIDSNKASARQSTELKALNSSIANDLAGGDKEAKNDIMQAMASFGPAAHLFFLKDYKEFLALFGDKAKAQDPLLYSMYYFIAIDNGAPLLMQTMMGIGADEQDTEDVLIKSMAGQKLMNDSINLGYTRKKGWLDSIKGLATDLQIKLGGFLSVHKGKSGRTRHLLLLEDIVPEKTEAVKRIIKEHLSQKDVPGVDIAYILLALQDVELVCSDIEYSTFHHAIQFFMKKDFPFDKAQKAYTDIKKNNCNYDAHGSHSIHAKHTINLLAEKFEEC